VLDELRPVFDELTASARAELAADGEQVARITEEVDLRYRGQAFALTVAIAAGPDPLAQLLADFRSAYTQAYGSHPDGPIELVTVRARATLTVGRPGRAPIADRPAPAVRSRPVSFDPESGYVATPVLRRDELPSRRPLAGPAIVEDDGSTTVVPPGWVATLLVDGVLELRRPE
jgi:N-methylhydantoinase A